MYVLKKRKKIFELRVLNVAAGAIRKELLVFSNPALPQPSKKTGKCIFSDRMVFPMSCRSYWEL
jgi:hypothetical protein